MIPIGEDQWTIPPAGAASHEAMILWAMIALIARRLAQTTQYQTLTKGQAAARRRG
jgi:hypothetical protein